MPLRSLARRLCDRGRNGKPARLAARQRYRARLEALEDRLAPATFIVNSTADPGNSVCDVAECTLREALTAANGTPGTDTVAFNIAGAAPYRIQVRSALPVVTDSVLIDGTTEPDFQGNPLIILDGSSEPVAVVNGLEITAGNSTVRGLVISLYTGTGLVLRTGGNNRVEGNYIGTNVSGTLPNPNLRGGIAMLSSNGNIVGGATPQARNVISGNGQHGVFLDNASSNRIQGNYIGTSANGNGGLGNTQDGMAVVNGSQNNFFGTDGDGTNDLAERNVVSANGWDGIGFGDPMTRNNTVAGNYIGLNAAGTAALGNGQTGVWMFNGTSSNRIGTNGDGVSDLEERNIISGNRWDGIQIRIAGTNLHVIAGNYIGLNAAGTAALGNAEDGIELVFGPQGVRIGTNGDGVADDAERNVISGNALSGIAIKGGSPNNVVAGNYIGTNAAGTGALGNLREGIFVEGRSDFTRIGTNGNGVADEAERNIISGNGFNGIVLVNVRTTRVGGNYIGTNAAGTAALGNGVRCSCDGVQIVGGSQANVIGTNGDSADNLAERNIISGNSRHGVVIDSANTNFNVVAGNFIGTDTSGRQRLSNKWVGVVLYRAGQNRVGTDSNGLADEIERNVIGASGNYESPTGVWIERRFPRSLIRPQF